MSNQHMPSGPQPGSPLLIADVIVDVASLGFAIGEATQRGNGRRPDLVRPDLYALVAALGRRGMQVRSLQVAVPLVSVKVGPRWDMDRAQMWTAQWATWLADEAANLDVATGLAVTPLLGATDGVGEVGVDEQVAWAALEAAGAIADSGDPSREVVVVVSSDSDMWDLAGVAAPVRLFVAGGFIPARRDVMLASRIPFVRLSQPTLASLAPDAVAAPPAVSVGRAERLLPPESVTGRFDPASTVVIEHLDGGNAFIGSSPLDGVTPASTPDDVATLVHARTIAVVDAYGLSLAARRAIGVAELPGAAEVRSLLAMLGWDAPVATLFVVPDLSHRHVAMGSLSTELRRAWFRRDRNLDALADDLDDDGDPLTQARRAELRPDGAEVILKRVSTGLVADLWRANRLAPDAELVVLTEDPDLSWLLRCAPTSHRSFPRVTRVGLHSHRVEPVGGSGYLHDAAMGQVVVLTEHLAAQLVGLVGNAYGRSLRDRLSDATDGAVHLDVHHRDPESGGFVVTVMSADDGTGIVAAGAGAERALDEVRTVLHAEEGTPVAEQLSGALDGIDGVDTVVELHFDPRRSCSVPQVVVGDPGADGAATREARVVQREGYRLWVDIDFDGVADLAVSTGHDTTTYRTDDVVVLQRLDGAGTGWVLKDPGAIAAAPPDTVPLVLAVESVESGGGWARDLDSGRRGWLEPLPGESELRPARHVLAVEMSVGSDTAPEWMAISTGLDHLDHMLDPVD